MKYVINSTVTEAASSVVINDTVVRQYVKVENTQVMLTSWGELHMECGGEVKVTRSFRGEWKEVSWYEVQ